MLGVHTDIFQRDRSTFGPVQIDETEFHEAYKTLRSNDWQAEELERDLQDDELMWPNIPEDIKNLLTNVLAFFLHADDIVGDMALMFTRMLRNPIVNAFLVQQAANEIVHQQAYFIMVQRIYERNDPKTYEKVLNGETLIGGSNAYLKKLEWAKRWIEAESVHPCERLIAFGMTEGVLFASSFASIFFVRSRQGKTRKCNLHGLFFGNELVMQDENLHFRNTAAMFRALDPKDRISTECIHEIIRSAVETEDVFVDDTIPKDFHGLKKEEMKTYVRWIADRYTQLLGIDSVYGVETNPLDYMTRLWMHERNNPFERKGSQYAKHTGSLSASNGEVHRMHDSRSARSESAFDSPTSSEELAGSDVQCEGVLELQKAYAHLNLSTDF